MHPSDNPGVMLVQVLFDGTGYRSWRRGVLRALLVKNKLGFINGECKKPDLKFSMYRLWDRCDDMVTSWILNSLAKEIADGVEYINDAVELWKELEDRYDQTNCAKLYQIQKEINDLSQGNIDITAYYTKMKKLWEELSTLSVKIRGSILMMNPLPSMAQPFCLLVQEEKQREIRPSNQLVMKSASLNVNTTGSNNFRTNYLPNNKYFGNNRSRPMCDYCKKPGHTKDKCYKLHGYPQNFQNTQNPSKNYKGNRENKWKGKRTLANVHGTSTDITSMAGDDPGRKDESQNTGNGGDSPSGVINGAVNFAGPFNEEASGDW
ncbi:uncharacterized protein LOC107805052 [Nicotiana tabacum]|uniref:Uncharacterized protein LOC107805052 n=1 Tax=Nicotiana tabacum TaxID=4097 RepID=A0AC58TXA0_TOBAC